MNMNLPALPLLLMSGLRFGTRKGMPLFLGVFFWAGCLGYRVGGHLPPGIRSIFVPTVENAADLPLLETDVTAAIIENFHSDGRIRMLGADEADAVLEVRVNGSAMTPVRYDREAAVTAEAYRLTLTAAATLTRRADGALMLDEHEVEGWVEFEVRGDLPAARRDAASEAARELGRQVVRSVVEYW